LKLENCRVFGGFPRGTRLASCSIALFQIRGEGIGQIFWPTNEWLFDLAARTQLRRLSGSTQPMLDSEPKAMILLCGPNAMRRQGTPRHVSADQAFVSFGFRNFGQAERELA
jgi:hypothetical protein